MPGDIPVISKPERGYFTLRRRGGAFPVPVSIQPYGEEFSALVAQVGDNVEPLFATWERCYGNRITEAEYRYMTATYKHCQIHEPEAPEANPYKPIDITKMKPAF